MKKEFHIALVGNPNSGKTSLFNLLTGLHQRVGNFTGVTVEKKTGTYAAPGQTLRISDLPGTYSLYPNSLDERIVVETLLDNDSNDYPDAIIYVTDITKLEKQTLLLTQLLDLGFPVLWVMNLADLEGNDLLQVDTEKLQKQFGIPILKISTKTGEGIARLKEYLSNLQSWALEKPAPFYHPSQMEKQLAEEVSGVLNNGQNGSYKSLITAHHYQWLSPLTAEAKGKIKALRESHNFKELNAQVEETMTRYDQFTPLLNQAVKRGPKENNPYTDRADRIFTHYLWGPIAFLLIMTLVFQAIFSWASYPMDWVDGSISWLGTQTKNLLPAGWFTDLLTDGILAGFGGILIFVPQIAILFVFIGFLEEVGYMARVAYIWDRFMQIFGLNGRSTVALISGGACAIPAIMSARTITNRKERLITILVTPFISCSARIPVYTVLIGFVVPADYLFGIFNIQGLAFLGLYLMGIFGGALVALVLKYTIKSEERSFLALELPPYHLPAFRNVLLATWSKVKSFIREAGKIILAISIVLWFAASYGPGKAMQQSEAEAISMAESQQLSALETESLLAGKKLEASYAGQFGKFIEPAIRPLGFDWKMGIAILTSFAAREVFVSTMSTIYNIGSSDDEVLIRDRMAQEVNPITGEKVYTIATSLALLIFYVFAMQCMSTVAVIRKETGGWKWAIVIFLISTGIAYFGALAVYQLLG